MLLYFYRFRFLANTRISSSSSSSSSSLRSSWFILLFTLVALVDRTSPIDHFEPPNSVISGDVRASTDSIVWHELQSTWPYRFAQNCFGYLAVVVPIIAFVYFVKNFADSKSKLTQNRLTQLFVYGCDGNNCSSFGSIELKDPLLPVSHADAIVSDHPHQHAQSKSKLMRDASRLAFCFVGLQLSYLTWGLLQEKIMTQDYEIESEFFRSHQASISNNLISFHQRDNHEIAQHAQPSYHIKFRNSQFLVFVNRALACAISIAVLLHRHWRHLSRYFLHSKQPPAYQYLHCSLSNILSSWCQYEALKYVSFPVQVLSKGCKVIAVMIMSMALRGKRYQRAEWLAACAISFGIWLFLLNEQQEEAQKHHHRHDAAEQANDSAASGKLFSGIAILALYLTFDSFTSNWQSQLFDRYKISPIHMMASVNAYSILLTSVSLMQQSDFFPAFKLLLANGSLLHDCVLLSICSAIGQLFVYHTISTFGPVIFTLIMTLRQVFAILLSIVIYDHALTAYGALGIIVVFGAIFCNSYQKYHRAKVSSATSGGNTGDRKDSASSLRTIKCEKL